MAVDALLHGLPVLLANRGGLPEAGMGVATLLPVQGMTLGKQAGTGWPCWDGRAFADPPNAQVVAEWVAGIQGALAGGPEGYEARGQQGRSAALAWLQEGGQQLQAFLDWLEGLGVGSTRTG